MSLEIIALTLAANAAQEFYFNGEYFEILDAQYPMDVTLKDRNGVPMSILRNAEASFYARPGHYGTIVLQSAQAQVVRFMYGSGDVGTRRISSTVQVVDGGKARTLAGAAFMGAMQRTQLAANNSYVQLWNPAGSGKNLIVKAYGVGASSAGGLTMGFGSVALVNLLATAQAKLAGGAAPVAQIRNENSNVSYFTNAVDTFYAPALQSSQRALQEPLMLPPGKGFNVAAGVTDLNCSIEWVEEVI
jgi:hypothetical protein